MSYNLSALCYVGVRSLIEVLSKRRLPLPDLTDDGVYAANAEVVRLWVNTDRSIWNGLTEGAHQLDINDLRFVTMMQVVLADISDYCTKHPEDIDEMDVPDGYVALFY